MINITVVGYSLFLLSKDYVMQIRGLGVKYLGENNFLRKKIIKKIEAEKVAK